MRVTCFIAFFSDCSRDFTLLFLVDRTRDVAKDNVERQVAFIISLTSTMSFNDMAVVSYATDAEIVIRPGQASNFSEFAQILRSANYSRGHMKNLGNALTKSQEITELFNRSKPALAVAMISGKSHDDQALPAEELKKRGVTIIALAFGNYSIAQLRLLVSKPDSDHIITTGFPSLKHSISNTRNAICKGTVSNNP